MRTPPRTRFQGVAQIVRFNWPFYLTATLLLAAGGCAVLVLSVPFFGRAMLFAAIAAAAFWLITSLIISHYIYDRAGIYDGIWIQQALSISPKRWTSFHAGLDEFSALLRKLYPESDGSIVDLYDPNEMTEPSIKRARHLTKESARSIHVNFRALPLQNDELDAAFVLFSAHELRKSESRILFFSELRRILRSHGKIILLEHLRDWPNFFAFGPGCFHFHSRRTWSHSIGTAGLFILREFTLTPFVRAFVLAKAPPDVTDERLGSARDSRAGNRAWQSRLAIATF
jgi:SAM-dependent methyltransferase